MTRQYVCQACGGKFESDQTDEAAEEDMLKNEGFISPEERAIVCDDCYQILLECLDRPQKNLN